MQRERERNRIYLYSVTQQVHIQQVDIQHITCSIINNSNINIKSMKQH